MNCPRCGNVDTPVMESHTTEHGVHRRRECRGCEQPFNTLEHVQLAVVMVVKRDGRREQFQREKLLDALRVCARKRPLAAHAVEAVADEVEQRLLASGRHEVPSRVIAEMVITHLRRLDPIAYIRFASVYRPFVSLEDMLSDLDQLAHDPVPPAEQARLFEDDFDRLIHTTGSRSADRATLQVDGADGPDMPPPPTPIGSARSASRV